VSHLRRINTPIEKTGKLVQPRKLHPTQWGVICPSETPEGASVGLVKNLATMASVTIALPSDGLRNNLVALGVRVFEGDPTTMFGVTKIFVNVDLVGVHETPEELFTRLKQMK
jgi:DNA-directed RNA polymerase II subunit RPB2